MIYFVIIMIVLVVVINGLLRKYALTNVTYRRELSKSTVEIGELLEITTIIENAKRLPVTFLQVNEKFPVEMKYLSKVKTERKGEYIFHTATMLLMPYQRIKRTYNICFERRGRYLLKDAELISGDMLGFNVDDKAVEYWQEVVVYPECADLQNAIEPYGDYMGSVSVKRWIIDDPILTIGFNEYTGREPQKYINWPVSLRTGKLMVNKFDYTIDNNVMIILNIAFIQPFWVNIEKDKIERALSLTRAFMEQFEAGAIPYGFATNIQGFAFLNQRAHIEPCCGAAHYYSILEGLARAEYAVSMSFEKLLEERTKEQSSIGTYVIVTPEISKSCIEYINILNSTANKTILVTLDAENITGIDENICVFTERGEKDE